MDAHILNLIFKKIENQKNSKHPKNENMQDGISFRILYPIILQDKLLNINSKSGAYSAIERMKKAGLVEVVKIKKTPPEIIIKLTEKGMGELAIYSGIMTNNQSLTQSPKKNRSQIKSQDGSKINPLTKSLEKSETQVRSLKQYLEKSKSKIQSLSKNIKEYQDQVQSLKQSLEKSESQKILPKKTNTEKEMVDLDDSEYKERALRIKDKIIDVLNIDEENFSKDQLEIIEETAEEILDYARK